jgi:hypothetical protein
MTLSRFLLFASVPFLVTAVAGSSSAQSSYVPFNQPRVSPYLNLLRGGASPGVNYYDLVRPQFQFRNSIQQLQQQVGADQQALAGLQGPGSTPTTGHPVGFMTHLSYFQTLSSTGGGAFTVPTTGQTPPRSGTAPQGRAPAPSGGARR